MALRIPVTSARPAVVPLANLSATRASVTIRSAQLPRQPAVGLSSISTAAFGVQQRRIVASATTSANFDEGLTGTDDYSPVVAVAGFVAVWFNKLSVDRVKLVQALAILQLVNVAINVVTRKGTGDKVATVVGPGVLAAAVLSIKHVTYLDVATLLFGYFLSETLEDLTKLPAYGFIATLVAAIYFNYGTLWYTVAFGVAALFKIYNSSKANESVPVLVIPALLASLWAVYKEAHFPLALCIYLANTLWSGLRIANTLTNRVQD